MTDARKLRISSVPDRAALALTVGHSTRSIEAFVDLLKAHGVERVVDVRTIPRSRKNPQFNLEVLPQVLKTAGIRYQHVPQLGGLRRPKPESTNTAWRNASFRGFADYMQTRDFEQGIRILLDLARKERVAIMCAEAVPWRCHRSLIADALCARGVQAEHILSPTRREKHQLTPFALVQGERVLYPGTPAPSQENLRLD